MKKKLPYASYDDWQIEHYRKNPKRAIAYLNAAIEVAYKENEPELVLIALATVAKSRGMTRVAKAAELKRESLHRMLSERGNPEWTSLFKVIRALDLRPKLEPA